MGRVGHLFLYGCGKCGTTSLAHLLGSHPEVTWSVPKEPNYFAGEYHRGRSWYEGRFAPSNASWRGDGSVAYSIAERESEFIARVQRDVENPRFIYIARNPFSRLESVFREHLDSGHKSGILVPRSLEAALVARPAMIENTRYWARTEPVRAAFGSKSLLLLVTEHLAANPVAVLSQVCRFLDIDPAPLMSIATSQVWLNRGAGKRMDSTLLRVARRVPYASRVYRHVPEPLRRTLEPVLRPQAPQVIEWSQRQRRHVAATLRQDMQSYLGAVGLAPDFWGEEFA